MHPYRDAEAAPPKAASRRALFDGDLAGVYLVVWIVCVARVAVGLALHQTFGAELTLAALAVVLLPWLSLSSRSARSTGVVPEPHAERRDPPRS